MEYTFAVVTYNHSDYIYECLESIKHVIQKYGKGHKCYLIVSDDASVDDTVNKVNKWVSINRFFFVKTKVLANSENLGISRNFQQALRNVETEFYKIIAGDDIFNDRDLFAIQKKNTLVITPSVSFSGSIVNAEVDWTVKRLFFKKKLKGKLKKYMQYCQPFGAPGAFWNWNLKDERIYEALDKYKTFEDTQLFAFLINETDIEVEVSDVPYVLYRVGAGISTGGDDKINEGYMRQYRKEEEQSLNDIFVKRGKDSFLNLWYDWHLFSILLYKYLFPKISIKYRMYENKQLREVGVAGNYLRKIKKTSAKYGGE